MQVSGLNTCPVGQTLAAQVVAPPAVGVQRTVPVGQVHTPLWQTSPEFWQAFPHVPQLSTSLLRLVHAPLQQLSPTAQHTVPQITWPVVDAGPQVKQRPRWCAAALVQALAPGVSAPNTMAQKCAHGLLPRFAPQARFGNTAAIKVPAMPPAIPFSIWRRVNPDLVSDLVNSSNR